MRPWLRFGSLKRSNDVRSAAGGVSFIAPPHGPLLFHKGTYIPCAGRIESHGLGFPVFDPALFATSSILTEIALHLVPDI